MLRRLHIRNYLLIEELDLSLEKGLTIITGETGSGKSIVIGALGLAMGERAGTGVHRDAKERCVIELEVDTKGLDLNAWFEDTDIPLERSTILRRQLDPGGRSRAFVNDTPVKLEQLRELGERLVHVHSQHHTLLLNDPSFQLGLVDHVAGQRTEVVEYGKRYAAFRSLQRQFNAVKAEQEKAQIELDHLQFQLEELDEARLEPDEQASIELELARAENAEELIQGIRAVEEGITSERGASGVLARMCHAIAKPARLDPRINALLDRLNSVHIELKDIADEADRSGMEISIEPARVEQLKERSDLLNRLQQKHRVSGNAELIALREELRTRIGGINILGERIEDLAKQVDRGSVEVMEKAKALSKGRIKAAKPLANKVEGILHELGMPHVVFRIELRTGDPGPHGIDDIHAMFSANSDRMPAPLDKVASGGELSRVMLALISLAADSQNLPTVIFDEVDTGVSGEVADRVGMLMARMGKQRQVLAITHLPQIASKADTHLVVTKDQEEHATSTSIQAVLADERVKALAQMLSGRKVTKAAMDNARALLKD